MLRTLLPENQSYKNIYLSLGKFFDSLDKQDWLIQYLNWEINLITNLGFGFDFDIKKIPDLNSKKIYNNQNNFFLTGATHFILIGFFMSNKQ